MVMITLYAKQKNRHRCIEQTFRLRGRSQGWDVQREQHWNKYTIKGETDHQPWLDAWDKCSGLVHWEDFYIFKSIMGRILICLLELIYVQLNSQIGILKFLLLSTWNIQINILILLLRYCQHSWKKWNY